jgi:hypothetical protein
MSIYTAIADVGETLLNLLRENMQDLVNPASIILSSPGEIEAQDSPRLCLFLYQVAESPHLRNQQMQSINSITMTYPPLTLDMYFMLTSYGSPQIADKTDRTIEAHRILGRAMSILYDNAILRGSLLTGDLAGSGEELKITLFPIPLEELNRIWNSFPDKSLRLSVCYMVTPVKLDSTREMDTRRVVEQETNYYQMREGSSP